MAIPSSRSTAVCTSCSSMANLSTCSNATRPVGMCRRVLEEYDEAALVAAERAAQRRFRDAVLAGENAIAPFVEWQSRPASGTWSAPRPRLPPGAPARELSLARRWAQPAPATTRRFSRCSIRPSPTGSRTTETSAGRARRRRPMICPGPGRLLYDGNPPCAPYRALRQTGQRARKGGRPVGSLVKAS